MIMVDINIACKLKEIFENRFGINQTYWNNETVHKHLLSSSIGFAARDLIYLFFDIEKEFEVKIPEEYIVQGRFCSFSNILEMIKEIKCHM